MERFGRIVSRTLFPLMIGVSLAAGTLIPAFYDWSGADQSRPSPLAFWFVTGLVLCGVLICFVLPWLPIENTSAVSDHSGRVQFKIRTVMVITAVVAVLIVVLPRIPMLVMSCGFQLIGWGYVIKSWRRTKSFRWPIATLMASMYLPYAWLLAWNTHLPGVAETLTLLSGLPAFIPAAMINSLVHRNLQELAWLSISLTGTELILGMWIVKLGLKRFIAYTIVVQFTSIIGSLGIHALMRM